MLYANVHAVRIHAVRVWLTEGSACTLSMHGKAWDVM